MITLDREIPPGTNLFAELVRYAIMVAGHDRTEFGDKPAIVTASDVEFEGMDIGDWRVTIEQIRKPEELHND